MRQPRRIPTTLENAESELNMAQVTDHAPAEKNTNNGKVADQPAEKNTNNVKYAEI